MNATNAFNSALKLIAAVMMILIITSLVMVMNSYQDKDFFIEQLNNVVNVHGVNLAVTGYSIDDRTFKLSDGSIITYDEYIELTE